MCWNIRSKTVNIRQTHQILLSKFRRHVSTLYGHLQALIWNKSELLRASLGSQECLQRAVCELLRYYKGCNA
jgi:hypothetical protein